MDKNTGKPETEQERRGVFTGSDSRAVVMELTPERAQEHIRRCREITGAFVRRVFPDFWSRWCHMLSGHLGQANSNKEQARLAEWHDVLSSQQQAAEHRFVQILNNNFIKFSEGTLVPDRRRPGPSPAPVATPARPNLSLVTEGDLEESIAIDSIVHRADVELAESLWALNQRLALLNGGRKVDEKGNPASPWYFCEALREITAWDDLDMGVRLVGYKVFDRQVVQRMGELYDDLNSYLVANQLLTNLRYAAKGSDGGREGRSDSEDQQTGQAPHRRASDQPPDTRRRRASDRIPEVDAASPEEYQAKLLQAIRMLQTHVAKVAEPVVGGEQVPQPAYDSAQLVGVLQNMQARARERDGQGSGLQLVQPQLVSQQVLAEIAAASSAVKLRDNDRQTIDLVGMLFQYMLADDNLPDSVKALLSYLHTPFLKIAFLDQGFLDKSDHPARVLLNMLAEAGARWVSNDGRSQYDMYNRIKATVFRLLQEFEDDLGFLDQLVKDFQEYIQGVARRQTLVERRALEKVRGEETLREAKILVNTEVQNRIQGKDLPSAVLLLLLQPWSDYLSFVLLRYGQESEHWDQALFVMDELLWSIEPKVLQADKERLEKYRDKLVQAVNGAFEAICYEQTRGRKLLDSVLALQDQALKSRRVEPAPSAMRSKLEAMAAEKAGNVTAREKITPEEAELMDKLKLIEFGTWLEMKGGQRVKVSWFNRKTLNYMLVDQQGNKVSVATGLQLARQMIAGEARVIAGSAKPFFERALENIYRQLNASVEPPNKD